jgi:hypothetical protein
MAHTGAPRPLLTDPGSFTSPDVSPATEQLVFAGSAGLYSASPDGAEIHHIPTPGVTSASNPRFSRDGKQILFSGLMLSVFEGDSVKRLMSVDLDGGGLRVLTSADENWDDPNSGPDDTVIATRRVPTYVQTSGGGYLQLGPPQTVILPTRVALPERTEATAHRSSLRKPGLKLDDCLFRVISQKSEGVTEKPERFIAKNVTLVVAADLAQCYDSTTERGKELKVLIESAVAKVHLVRFDAARRVTRVGMTRKLYKYVAKSGKDRLARAKFTCGPASDGEHTYQLVFGVGPNGLGIHPTINPKKLRR